MYGIKVKNVDSESPYEHKLMNKANGKPFRENAAQAANLFQSKLLSNHTVAKRMRAGANRTYRPDNSRMSQNEGTQITVSDSPEVTSKGKALFINRNQSPF